MLQLFLLEVYYELEWSHMKMKNSLAKIAVSCIVGGVIFLGLISNSTAVEKNKYKKITYPEVGAFFLEPQTTDATAEKQLNDYLNRRLVDLKSETRLKNYLPRMTAFLLNYTKDTTNTGSITYKIEEKKIVKSLKVNQELETVQRKADVTTISTKTGNPLMLHELFNDEETGYQEIKTKLTKKVEESVGLSDQQKMEIMKQVNEVGFENTTHYGLSNNELIFQFPTEQGIEIVGFAKNQVRRQLKAEYMTEALNQQVAEEVKQEEAIRAQKEAERKAAEERQRIIESQQTKLPSSGKVIALTFDDGPDPAVTPRVLDLLAKYNARATFFVLGKNAAAYPNLVVQEINAGHEIGNHSWSHPDLTALPKEKALNQVNQTNQTIQELTGYTTNLLRPPYGAITNALASDVKMPIIEWSVDTMDWKSKNGTAVYQETMKNAQNGSIVLMHDIHPTTADGLERILKDLTAQGYKFVTISELFGTPMQPGLQYYSRGSVR